MTKEIGTSGPSLFNISLAIAFLGLAIGLCSWPQQSDFGLILLCYIPIFIIYVVIYQRVKNNDDLYFFLGISILVRVSLLFLLPQLSDDVYRFIWDGRLLNAGYNPFDQLPTQYLKQRIPGIDQALYEQLNSPTYFTIYPPVAQGVFAIACWIFPSSIIGASIIMKSFLLLCELISIFLLPRLLSMYQLPQKNTLLYALNPLIIVEISGNLHFEGAMICFLLLALWFLQKQQYHKSALVFALSIASKLLPLMFLPLLIRRLGWTKSIRYFLLIGVVLGFLFLPLMSGFFWSNFGESLDLYFRRFEFNASIYYITRWLGYQYAGYNLIAYLGPSLALLVLLGILLFTFFERKPNLQNLPQAMLFCIVLYLFLTTTIHPWYTSLPIVLCIFTRFRFPILWSGLIFLTYINYSYGEYYENLAVVGLEYSLLIGMILWEWLRPRKSTNPHSPVPEG